MCQGEAGYFRFGLTPRVEWDPTALILGTGPSLVPSKLPMGVNMSHNELKLTFISTETYEDFLNTATNCHVSLILEHILNLRTTLQIPANGFSEYNLFLKFL